MFNSVRKTILRVTEWMLPADSASSDEQGRKRLFALFLILLIIPFVIFGAAHFRKGFYTYWIIDHMAALILAGFVIALRYMKRPIILYRITILMIGAMLFYWLKTGAVHGHASIWIVATPIYFFFLTGRREGLFWTIILTVGTIALFINPFNLLDVWKYEPEYVSRHLFTMFIIFLFTYSYESVKERFKRAIVNEQSLLLREKEHLAAAKSEVDAINERLSEEMDVRIIAENDLKRHRDNLEAIVEERTRELQRYNLELRESEKRYRLLADNVNDLIFSLGMNFKIEYISPSITAMYGYTVEEAKRLTMADIHSPESLDMVMKVFQEQTELDKNKGADPERHAMMVLVHRRKDGSLFDVEIKASFLRDETGKPVGIVGIIRDISDRIRAQQENEKMREQLAQSQKMEAIGTLVGGLAHDFNNILSGILGSFDLLRLTLGREKLEDRETVDKYLAMGMESAKRSVNLIKELLTLSQRHEIKPEPIDMNEAVRHIHELCTNSLPKSIELDFHYSPEQPLIMGDMVQIGQVLLNLCINASHAMTIMRRPDERQGGRLSVMVDKIEPEDYSSLPVESDIPGGRGWVRITIGDTGVGMDHETVMRIYEPFYTRKKRGEGTGLGLSISYNIIQKHGGLIRVSSEPGAGTHFTLLFPACDSEAGNSVRHPVENDLTRGTGTILVIDDEAMVLNVVRGFLTQCGYEVITADSPDRGIEIFSERRASIAAVIIDLAMPGKSGLEVFQTLKNIDPGVRAILSSGMLDNESRERAAAMGIRDFANKPYFARELSVILHNILQ